MVEGNQNSAGVCKRKENRPIFAVIAPSKNITGNWRFREKRSVTYVEALQSVGILNSGGEVLEPLKSPNVLKEENYNFNRIVGIDWESMYARYREEELLGSYTLSSPTRLARRLLLLKIHLGIETYLLTLMERIMRS